MALLEQKIIFQGGQKGRYEAWEKCWRISLWIGNFRKCGLIYFSWFFRYTESRSIVLIWLWGSFQKRWAFESVEGIKFTLTNMDEIMQSIKKIKEKEKVAEGKCALTAQVEKHNFVAFSWTSVFLNLGLKDAIWFLLLLFADRTYWEFLAFLTTWVFMVKLYLESSLFINSFTHLSIHPYVLSSFHQIGSIPLENPNYYSLGKYPLTTQLENKRIKI